LHNLTPLKPIDGVSLYRNKSLAQRTKNGSRGDALSMLSKASKHQSTEEGSL